MDFDLKFLLKFSACVVIGFCLAIYSPYIQQKYTELKTQKEGTEKRLAIPEPTSKYPKRLPDLSISLPEEIKPSVPDQLKSMGYTPINPKKYEYSCPDMKTIISRLQETSVYALESNEQHRAEIMYRDSAMKPFYKIFPAHNYLIAMDKESLDNFGPNATINLTEYLIEQGFKMRSESSVADIYYGYSLTSFEKNDWNYTIELGSQIGISLACAPSSTIQQQSVADLDAIVAAAASTSKPFSPFTIIEQWGYNDNVYQLNTYRMFSNGHAEYWGKVEGTWKLLSSTQDLPQCEPFIQNKVGKGTKCFACTKGYNPADGSCEETAEMTVSY